MRRKQWKNGCSQTPHLKKNDNKIKIMLEALYLSLMEIVMVSRFP